MEAYLQGVRLSTFKIKHISNYQKEGAYSTEAFLLGPCGAQLSLMVVAVTSTKS